MSTFHVIVEGLRTSVGTKFNVRTVLILWRTFKWGKRRGDLGTKNTKTQQYGAEEFLAK